MRRIPWRLSLRYSRKGLLTVFGAGFAVAFAMVSFSIADGLERTTTEIARNHPTDTLLLTGPGGGPFDPARLSGIPGAVGVVLVLASEPSGGAIVIASVGDRADLGNDSFHPLGEGVHPSEVVVNGRELRLGPPAEVPLPAAWYVATPSALGLRDPFVHYAIAPNEPTVEARARDAGLHVQRAPAMERFFAASGAEISRDVLLIVVFSSLLAMTFCYELLRSEVRERRREIGIWRSVGMRGRDVVLLFLARAGAIGIAGVLVGWAFAALALAFAYEHSGQETLRFELSFERWGLVAVTFVTASLVGGILPAFIAQRIKIQHALETGT